MKSSYIFDPPVIWNVYSLKSPFCKLSYIFCNLNCYITHERFVDKCPVFDMPFLWNILAIKCPGLWNMINIFMFYINIRKCPIWNAHDKQKDNFPRQASNLPDKHSQTDKHTIYQTNTPRQTNKQSTRQTLPDRHTNNLPDKHCQIDMLTTYQTNIYTLPDRLASNLPDKQNPSRQTS